jgi:hypothetical protein
VAGLPQEITEHLVDKYTPDIDIWKRMLFDQYANYVFQTIVERISKRKRDQLFHLIQNHLDSVKPSVRRRLADLFNDE